MKIEVTQEDIDRGINANVKGDYCPVERAMTRACGEASHAGMMFLRLGSKGELIDMPPEVAAWISSFDASRVDGRKVAPFTFDLPASSLSREGKGE